MDNHKNIDLDSIKKKLDDTLLELFKSKNLETAEKVLEQSLKVYDEHKYHQLLTIVKQRLEKNDENDILFKNICERYDNPDDWNNYSIHLKNKRLFKEAVLASKKAIDHNEKNPVYYCNQAMSLTQLDKYELALKRLDKAIQIDDKQWYFHANKACCLADIGRYQEAEDSFETAIKIPNCRKDVFVDYFYCLAFQKKYDIAWKYYENRYECFPNLLKYMQKNNLQTPKELSKDLEFCVFMEQGMGDNLMFLRFLPEFQAIYKNSYFVTNDNFEKICPSIRCTTMIKPETKYGISLLSLPYYLNVKEIPLPYKIGSYKKKDKIENIGIIWAGNPAHPMDYQRNCYAEDILSQIDFKKYKVYSFQKDKRPRGYHFSNEIFDYAKNLTKYNIIDLSDKLETINDTIKYMEEIDYFIGIDSFPMHIAASVGISCSLIVSDKPDWRWGKTERFSEWYPNVKIYRKEKTQSLKNTIGSFLIDLN